MSARTLAWILFATVAGCTGQNHSGVGGTTSGGTTGSSTVASSTDDACKSGSNRWCDEPIYCAWGQQTCGPDGAWGACVEVTSKPPGCDTDAYNPDCCVAAGQCCQAYNLPDPQASVGNCAGIICQ